MHAEELLWTIPAVPKAVLIFAHGAGAGPDSQFMQSMTEAIASHDTAVCRFEFPYWSKVRLSGKKRPPDRAPVLDECFIQVAEIAAERFPQLPLWISGKSMGARVALRCYQQCTAIGWIGFGFPFHPPGKPERHRLDEMTDMPPHSLIIQGTKDPFGNQAWASANTEKHISNRIHWVNQAGHDLHPPKSSGISTEDAWQQQASVVAEFIAGVN